MAIGYVDDSKLTAVADAIRAKKGSTDLMTLDQMPAEIEGIGGGSADEKNVKYELNNWTSGSILNKYINYMDLSKFPSGRTSLKELFSCQNFTVSAPITLENLDKIDTSKITNLNSLFYQFKSATSIDLSNWDTSKVTDMGNMFYYVSLPDNEIINLNGKFSITNVTNIKAMFQNSSFKEFKSDAFAITTNLTSLANLFQSASCVKIDLTGFKTPACTSMSTMFSGCNKLQTLLIPDLVSTNVTSVSSMFSSVGGNLVNVTWPSNWLPNSSVTAFDLSSPYNLSHDSILDLFNKLATRMDYPTLKLASTAKARMSDEEIKIATDKGWTIA